MNKKFITCSILFSIALLIGCNDSSNSSDTTTVSTPNETAGTPSPDLSDSFLNRQVKGSALTFKGEVIDISNRLSIEGIPHTFVTYEIHEIITGEYADEKSTITVKFAGGEFPNGYQLEASNAPKVNLGKVSIVMIQNSLDDGCDFQGCQEGIFNIENGLPIAANGSVVTVNSKGQVLYVSQGARDKGRYKSNLENSSVDNFIKLLKDIDEKSAGQRKGQANAVNDTDKNLPFRAAQRFTKAGPAPVVNKKNRVVNNESRNQKSDHDLWEETQLKQNDNNPVLSVQYQGDKQ